MNVDLACWNFALLTTLKRISTSHAVSFDLELSGIPVRTRGYGSGKQTLQQRYVELKHAAETFHILQFGLTLMEEDAENERYVLRSYNYNLSPLVDDIFGIDRNFTYSSGAVRFLLDHGYKMESPFSWGLRYLTKDEEVKARENYMRRNDRGSIPDIKIRDDDIKAIAFMQRVRDEINRWKNDKELRVAEYVITEDSALASGIVVSSAALGPIGGFQRRLVHQVVRGEFPGLVTYGRKDSVAVQFKNAAAEAEQNAHNDKKLKAAMYEQMAFRIITEGLAGGSLDCIDVERVGRRIQNEFTPNSTELFEKRLTDLETSLQDHQTVLVGHNCFLDLVYIYHNFYGTLPDTVEEFQAAVHKVFPLIIDTKYLATSSPDDGNRNLQLFELDEALAEAKVPKIESANDHPGYSNTASYHEAGYDSYATAKVFLRLCANLEADGHYVRETGARQSNGGRVQIPPDENDTVAVDASEFQAVVPKKRRKSKKKLKSSSSEDPNEEEAEAELKFSHANAFGTLRNLASDLIPLSAETPASTSNTDPSAKDGLSNATSTGTAKFGLKNAIDPRKNTKLLPPWDTDFWRVYGNKLRVFGTQEEVCDLTHGPSPQEDMNTTGDAEEEPDMTSRRPSATFWDMIDRFKKLI